MAISVNKSALAKAMAKFDFVSHREGKKSSIVLISQNSELKIISRDPDHFTELKVASLSEQETWQCSVSANAFHDIIKKIGSDKSNKECAISLSDHYLQIKDQNTEFNLTLMVSHTESISKVDNFASFLLTPDMINKVSFAMANDDLKHSINGIFIHLFDDKICTVATDDHRLAVLTTPISSVALEGRDKDKLREEGIILSRKTISRMMKFATEFPAKLGISHQYVSIDQDGYLASKLVDGVFRDYRAVLARADKNENHFDVEVSDLIEAIERISTLSDERNKVIRLATDKNKLHLVSSHHYLGHAESGIAISHSSLPSESKWAAHLNTQDLLDAAKHIEAKVVRFHVGKSLSLIKLTPIEGSAGSSSIFVVAPLNISG